jgi:hypothetical protein
MFLFFSKAILFNYRQPRGGYVQGHRYPWKGQIKILPSDNRSPVVRSTKADDPKTFGNVIKFPFFSLLDVHTHLT